jgi:FAD/FMN-containing dehydrogenase
MVLKISGKKPYPGHSRSPAEPAAMRRPKAALDPHGIFNPRKVFGVERPMPRNRPGRWL